MIIMQPDGSIDARRATSSHAGSVNGRPALRAVRGRLALPPANGAAKAPPLSPGKATTALYAIGPGAHGRSPAGKDDRDGDARAAVA